MLLHVCVIGRATYRIFVLRRGRGGSVCVSGIGALLTGFVQGFFQVFSWGGGGVKGLFEYYWGGGGGGGVSPPLGGSEGMPP